MIDLTRKTWRPGAVLFALLLLAVVPATAWAESISLNQCANGGIADMVSHEECHEGWINGNLNASKAAYAEGEFVPYRARLTGLTPGSAYTYFFSWDTLKSGKHALDYIGTYDHSVSLADACDGAAAPCPGTTSTFPIPADPALPFAQIPGEFTLFGGTITGATAYLAIAADVEGIGVEFVPDQANVVLAWGGHIASPIDWVGEETASDINGSPYHTSNVALVNNLGQTVASGGQDVQLSAAAVFVPSTINVTKESNAPGVFPFASFLDAAPIVPDDELDGTNPWSLSPGQTRTVDAMDDGTVTISELALPGPMWRIASIMCEQLGTGTVFSYVYQEGEPLEDTATFEVDEASTFNCTFVNEFFGAPVLLVIKKVVTTDTDCTDEIRDSGTDNETLSIHSGETVHYCLWVTNTGGDAAVDVTMVDDQANLFPGDVSVALTGYTDEDGDMFLDDLAVGGWLSGQLEMAINVPTNTQAINTATASGRGLILDEPVSDSDTAEVITDLVADCTVTAGAFAGAGDCATDAGPTAYVIKDSGTDVTWCADLAWDADAALDLQNVQAEVLGTGLSAAASDLSPGGSQDIAVGTDQPNVSETRTVNVTGSEGGLNAIQCDDMASVSVVSPGLNLLKLASTDGECFDNDGTDAAHVEILNGDPVWYCLRVMNTGDTPLTSVVIADNMIPASPWDVGNLAVGQTVDLAAQGPYYPSEDVTNVAQANGTEPLTGTPVGPAISQARVTVLRADVDVDKQVDLDSITLCDGIDDPPNCTLPNPDGNYDVTYAIVVTNHGPNTATGVSVTDELPIGFLYDNNDGGCLYDIPGHLLTCDLGDMAPAAEVTIHVYGEIDASLFELPWVGVTNQACANTDPTALDPDPSNNCDQASTSINTGPTRTIGWWGNHPNGIAACVDLSGGEIDLGYIVLRDEAFDDDVDATVSTDPTQKGKKHTNLMGAQSLGDTDGDLTTAPVMVKGILKASVARWGDGTQRSHIDQARSKASRQLTAAWCNETVFLSDFDEYTYSWPEIRAIMTGDAYLDGGGAVVSCADSPCHPKELQKVIASINTLNGLADLFNNSGDDLPIPLPAEPAQPHAPQDDPTDPSD